MQKTYALAIFLTSCLPTVAAANATDGPMRLEFLPPVVEAPGLCEPQSEMARAGHGTGTLSPETNAGTNASLRDLRIEIRALTRSDPVLHFDRVESLISEGAERFPEDYSALEADVDRIRLRIAAGREDAMRASNLAGDFVAAVEAKPRVAAPILHFAATLVLEGTGIERNEARGLALLTEAGYSGYHEALLDILERDASGRPVPGWTVPTEVALTIALGSIVGDLDPDLCQRSRRLARHYMVGDIVERNVEIATAWYAFAADLGDPMAAWRLAELHLYAEDIDKDNEQLLKYLEQAADGGLAFAKTRLAEVFEVGALVPRDISRARQLYSSAAELNSRAAKMRLVRLAEDEPGIFEDPETTRFELLQDLLDSEASRAWAAMRLYQFYVDRDGYWANEEEKRSLLTIAAEGGSGSARKLLADRLMLDAAVTGEFALARNLYVEAAVNRGNIGGFSALRDAYVCRLPNAPDMNAARHWVSQREIAASRTVLLDEAQTEQKVWQEDPAIRALIQSQAIFGRPQAVGNMVELLVAQDAEPETIKAWLSYSDRTPRLRTQKARDLLKETRADHAASPAIEQLQAAADSVGSDQAREIATLIADSSQNTADWKDVLTRLEGYAALGNGDALAMLAFYQNSETAERDLHTKFEKEIADHGDAKALMLSLPFLEAPERKEAIAKITAVVACDFSSALRFSRASLAAEEPETARKWANIASELSDGLPWQAIALGDIFAKLPEGVELAFAAYQGAHEMGAPSASSRLLELVYGTDAPLYDPVIAAEIILEMMNSQDGRAVALGLSRAKSADLQTAALLEGQYDAQRVLLAAAETGASHAMREYSRLLREDPKLDAATLKEAANWTTRAAEGGDVAAMMDLAEMLAFGLGVEPDPIAAREWLKTAAAEGHSRAESLLPLFGASQ